MINLDSNGNALLNTFNDNCEMDSLYLDMLEELHPDNMDRENRKAFADLGRADRDINTETLEQWLTTYGFNYSIKVGNWLDSKGKKHRNRVLIYIWWN